MDKININNLFSAQNDFDFKPLTVNNLYNSYTTDTIKKQNKINFNIDKLIRLREEKKTKIT